MKNFTMVIGRDSKSGSLLAVIPELPGCYTTGDSLKELESNARKAIHGFLDNNFSFQNQSEFFGVQSLSVEI